MSVNAALDYADSFISAVDELPRRARAEVRRALTDKISYTTDAARVALLIAMAKYADDRRGASARVEPERACFECGGAVAPDPTGSPGVYVHVSDEGEVQYDIDADHAPVPEPDDEVTP